MNDHDSPSCSIFQVPGGFCAHRLCGAVRVRQRASCALMASRGAAIRPGSDKDEPFASRALPLEPSAARAVSH